MDAKTIGKFLDKMNIGINTDNELMLDIKNNEMNVGLTNSTSTLLMHGSLRIMIDDMQIPVSKFELFQKSISTFDGLVDFTLENRLILKGKNTKKIPLTKWSDRGTKIIKMVEDATKDLLPISLKRDEYAIVTQDKELYSDINEVYFIMKDKQLTIQLKDETGFECSTEINDIDIPDGTYILPPLTFNILKKSENLEMFLTEKNAYFRETANNYVIKYVTPTMMKR